MSGPDRIWADSRGAALGGNWGAEGSFCQLTGGTEYIRRDRAVLAALPEVQALIAQLRDRAEKAEVEADFFKSEIKLRNKILDLGCVQTLIAGAFEAAAQAADDWFYDPSLDKVIDGRLSQAIRALIPADATAARDAMIAEGVDMVRAQAFVEG